VRHIGRTVRTGWCAWQVTDFTGTGISQPSGITTGPDGALWFTNTGNNTIGRITTAGKVTNFTGTGISAPGAITSGPLNSLWFTNGTHEIGAITPGGDGHDPPRAGRLRPGPRLPPTGSASCGSPTAGPT
jgi:virginiamycin B lyase